VEKKAEVAVAVVPVAAERGLEERVFQSPGRRGGRCGGSAAVGGE
jgi:hypothetical protein